jgi:RHS repeat-associated protein
VEEYTIDYLEYDLIWYVNDVNREHTEVLMTRREDRAFTRSYTYGNERLTWDYGAWKGGSKNLWNYYAWKYLPTQPSIHGQYVNDGRGSASMLLDTTSNNTQLSHYYEPYGETLTDGSLAPSTRRAQAGVWDFFGFNGEDYDASTGMSYLRARYLSIEVGAFITEDTVKGNIFNPASLNLRGYVEGNPVAYIDPSGHSVKSVWDSIVDTIGGWINPKPQIVYIELPPTPSPTPKPTPTLQPTLTPTLPPKPTPPLTPTPAPESSHSLIPEVPVGKTKKDQAQDVWKGREDVWRKTWQGVMNELSKCGSLGSNLTSTERMAILLLAAAYIGPGVGYKYSSKDKENYYRNALFEKVVDCSGLVKAAVKAAGMDLHGSSGDIFKTMKANGWLTEATTYEEFLNSGLLPGDLLFWVNKNPTSDGYGETSHVGFYLYTDEKGEVWILDSTGSENGPNVQKLWQDKKETGKHRYQAYAKLGQLP